MGNQAPGSEQGPKGTTRGETVSPTPKDRNRDSQMEQSGKQNQPGGSQRKDQPHDSDPGVDKDRTQR